MWQSVAPETSRNLVLMVLCRSCWFHKVSACSENHISSVSFHGPSASRIPWRMIVWDLQLLWFFHFLFFVIWEGVKKHLKIAFLQFHRYHGGHETGYSHSQWYGKIGFLWYLFYNLKPSSFCHIGADDWWRKISCATSWSDWEYWVLLLQYWTVSAVKCRKWAPVMYFSVT